MFLFPAKRKQHKKLRASTLVEVLVASVLIIIVFAIASMTLNTIFKNTVKRNTHAIETHINKLFYLYRYNSVPPTFQEEFKNWQFTVRQQKENNILYVYIEASPLKKRQTSTKKIIRKQIIIQ